MGEAAKMSNLLRRNGPKMRAGSKKTRSFSSLKGEDSDCSPLETFERGGRRGCFQARGRMEGGHNVDEGPLQRRNTSEIKTREMKKRERERKRKEGRGKKLRGKKATWGHCTRGSRTQRRDPKERRPRKEERGC